MSSFTAIKFIIPQITPFSFDLQLHEIDKFLHFGHMPWQLTHKLFSSPYMTSIIGIAYNIWFFIVWYVLFHFLISKHAVRSQFLLSFTLIWFVIGNLMAILLSSAGPCYAHLLNSSFSDYQPLMEKLHLHNQTLSSQGWWPIWALDTQNMLWRQYSTNIITIGAGISAMPSMHVALATLMALAFWRISKKIGVWFIAYAVVIQIGSVHLAWHYAIDGYIGAIATYVIWRFSGWVLQ
jgi:hypothetical protein